MLAAFNSLDDARHRAEFYRMWAAGQAAGLPHPRTLEDLGPRPSANTEAVRTWLLDGTKRGRGITELVKSGGKRFEEFERALLTLGEDSGSLDKSLGLLGDFYTRKHELMLWVKKKMAYPLINIVLACFIAPLPLVFMGKTTVYFVLAFGGVIVFLLLSQSILAAVAARYGRKPPLVRARFARALSTAIEAGLTLPRAVRLAADASASPEIREHVRRQSEKQLSERPIGESLAGCPHLTPDFFGILVAAEKTGDFKSLARLAELYEDGFR
jgi:type II secretory pathway component PulF